MRPTHGSNHLACLIREEAVEFTTLHQLLNDNWHMAIFIFFDESGNLDFSPTGTRYYFFGALTTRTPAKLVGPLNELRYDLIGSGLEIEYFHATEDKQAVRNEVFDRIVKVGSFEYDCIVIEKRKLNPILHIPQRFYPQFASYLLQYIFNRYQDDPAERIVVITDKIPVKRKRKAIEKAFMTYIRQNLQSRPFSILHHRSASHAGLQAADYCNWAIHKKWKDNERRPYNLIRQFIKSELDILQTGSEHFY